MYKARYLLQYKPDSVLQLIRVLRRVACQDFKSCIHTSQLPSHASTFESFDVNIVINVGYQFFKIFIRKLNKVNFKNKSASCRCKGFVPSDIVILYFQNNSLKSISQTS